MADFERFREAFEGDIVTPVDEDYLSTIARWATNATKRAKVVAFVKNAADIALALKYAKEAGLLIAVKGGGHSPAGASSVEGGLVIDLSRYLDGVTVDPAKKLAYVQGGARWATVDHETMKHGLATVAGTINTTGVGGLITGGGYGWLTSQHGLAIDNLVQATVVTADGAALIANDTENTDLFYGIRGAGSNFGIVIEFVLRLHPQRSKVFAGALIFGRHQVEAVGKVLDAWFQNCGEKEAVHALITRGPDRTPCLVAMIFYNGSGEEGHEKFKTLYDIGPLLDTTNEIPYEEMNTLMNHTSPPGRSWYMRGALRNTPARCLSLDVFDGVVQASETGDMEATLVLEFVSMKKINSVDPEKTPYRRNLDGNALAILQWTGDETQVPEAVKTEATRLTELVKIPGIAYGNYNPDSEAVVTEEAKRASRSPAEELFRENYSKLQAIKRKYDPEVVFNKWFVITPALAADTASVSST